MRHTPGRPFQASATVAALGAAIAGILAGAAPAAQRVDRSKPPEVHDSAAGPSVRRLAGPVVVDGRAWVEARPLFEPGAIAAPNGRFRVSLADPSDAGDLTRYRLLFAEPGGAPVALAAGLVSYAFVTADSGWIVFEPLEAVEVATWRRYSPSQAFGIRPYVVPVAASPDGRRLVVKRRDCAFDCQDRPDEYYEVSFPDRQAAAPEPGVAAGIVFRSR